MCVLLSDTPFKKFFLLVYDPLSVCFFQKITVRDKKITIHDKLIFSSETRSIMSLVKKKEMEVHGDV